MTIGEGDAYRQGIAECLAVIGKLRLTAYEGVKKVPVGFDHAYCLGAHGVLGEAEAMIRTMFGDGKM